MSLLRSALFALIFYPATVAAVLVAALLSFTHQEALRRWADGWALFHRRLAAAVLGIRTRIEGEVPRGAVLVAFKHESMFETLETVLVLKRPMVVLKRELAQIPLWGRAVRSYGMIPVDRAAGATALRRMMRATAAAKAEKRPIVIFPEGTRVAHGERPPLQPGFAGLYRALGLPVVPVALDSGRLYPRRRFVKRPGIVTMRFGEPIPPGLPRDEIEARVHAAINALN
ncbi:MAG: lysophospholipid acyltransferase family protein [Sphingosinicella sp.]